MIIQSLSIVVPAPCPNSCQFCVSKMHIDDTYQNQIEQNIRFRDLYKRDYIKRLLFARDNGCNTAMLTGDGEVLFNMQFIDDFAEWNRTMKTPFHWIELQTSGVAPVKYGGHITDELLRYLRNTIGVTTISLSLSNLFDENLNFEINQTPEKHRFNIKTLCDEIKKYDFNLRLSLNINKSLMNFASSTDDLITKLFDKAKELNANQITFRKLYTSGLNTKQDEWIINNDIDNEFWTKINLFIKSTGRELEMLPFGAMRYSVMGMSTVVDSDCMSESSKNVLKYLVLRPNCKLYTKWDDEGSLLF